MFKEPVVGVSPSVKLMPAALTLLADEATLVDCFTPEITGFVLKRDDEWVGPDADELFVMRNLKAIAFPHTSLGDSAFCAKLDGLGAEIFHLLPSEIQTITCTPEHTWGLIHAVHRRTINQCMAWQVNVVNEAYVPQRMLSRMTLGVLGYGRVGSKVAKIGQHICERVDAYDPAGLGLGTWLGLRSADSSADLMRRANILSINIGARADYGEIARHLSLLPQDAIVVNTAQPSKGLDMEATVLVENGEIWGYGTDRPAAENVLRYAIEHGGNIVVTPHIAGSTKDALETTQLIVIRKMLNYLREEAGT